MSATITGGSGGSEFPGSFTPILARTRTIYRPVGPVAYDCVKVIVVRDGSAVLYSEFGQRPVKCGDVVLLAANTLCASEPEDHVTVTTLYADSDHVVDQVFWQYVSAMHDRLDAQEFAATIYTEPAQIIGLGMDRSGVLMPWLDELVTLSLENRPIENFFRTQSLWFAVAHVIAPFITTSAIRTSSTQRATGYPPLPRHRKFAPLRQEARRLAQLLRADPMRTWSVTEMAREVHLSKSQVGRVFVEAFGKSPIAYLTMLRTERMAGLLRTTDTPIAGIAQEVGWRDPDFAARQFRRSVGVTPSKYRALSRSATSEVPG